MADFWFSELSDITDEELYAAYAPPRQDKPWLRVNFVSSADGAVEIDGRSEGLSGSADKRVFKVLRARCDVLLAGAGTVKVEQYRELVLNKSRRQWRRDHGLPELPVMAVVSGSAQLDPTARIFTQAPRRAIVICAADAPSDRIAALSDVAEVIAVGEGSVDFTAALAALHQHGLKQVLCEGGAITFGHLVAHDLVDELCLTMSPLLAGPGAARISAGEVRSATRRMSLQHTLHESNNLMLRYLRG